MSTWQEITVGFLEPGLAATSHLTVIVVYVCIIVRIVNLVDQIRRVVKVIKPVVKRCEGLSR